MIATKSSFAGVPVNGYVPAMRWKAGEKRALQFLINSGQAENVYPLLTIDNVADRKQNETKAIIPAQPAAYIDFIASEMQKTLQQRVGFVDTHFFDSQRDLDGLTSFFSTMFAQLTSLIPVVRLRDKQERRRKIRAFTIDRGAALRLSERQLGALGQVDDLLKDLGITVSSTDLIVDLEDLDEVRADADDLAKKLAAISWPSTPWRSFVVLAGAYPKTVEVASIDAARSDWLTYAAIRKVLEVKGLRVPSFGDYGIVHPKVKPTSGSGRGGGARPIIRYCEERQWRIRRSEGPPKPGAPSAYFELARSCAGSPSFMGADFSHGDQYIDDRATGKSTSPGQAAVYIAADWNHHLRFTSAQAQAALPSPRPRSPSDLREPTLGRNGVDEDTWDF